MDRRAFLAALGFAGGVRIMARSRPWEKVSLPDKDDDSGDQHTSGPSIDSVGTNDPSNGWRNYELLSHSTGYNELLADNDETRTVNYFWPYNGKIHTASFEIKESRYQYYLNRPRTQNYGHYASHPYQHQLLERVLDEVAVDSNNDGYGEIGSVLQYVQRLKYTEDRVATGWNEYPKYPIETLVERGGDCEDTAILMSTLLRRLGYSTVLLAFWDDNHMALGVAGTIQGLLGQNTYYTHAGRKYHYLEPTATGWNVGEQPPDIISHPEIIPIEGHPVLIANVSSSWQSTHDNYEVTISLRNIGDGTASNVYTRVQLRDGITISSKNEAFVRFIGENQEATRTITFDESDLPSVSSNSTPELMLSITEAGQLHDEATFNLQ